MGLVNEDYILDFIQYAKGDRIGPVNLDETFIKDKGFLLTQAVILNLLI